MPIITGIVASSFNAQMERRNIIFEDQVRKALLDGILDYAEKADLERLRKQFGMSKTPSRCADRSSAKHAREQIAVHNG